nr:MAG TPA: hypothetical protein [Caudoviricetes sp.]
MGNPSNCRRAANCSCDNFFFSRVRRIFSPDALHLPWYLYIFSFRHPLPLPIFGIIHIDFTALP